MSVVGHSPHDLYKTLQALTKVPRWSASETKELKDVMAAIQHCFSQRTDCGAALVERYLQIFVADRRTRPPPDVLEAIAFYITKRAPSFPVYALSNVLNCFARLDYRPRAALFKTAAHDLALRTDEFSGIDIASLVYAFARLQIPSPELFRKCSERLLSLPGDMPVENAAIILNSYAKLGEKDTKLFDAIAQSVVLTNPGNLQRHHIPLLYNAFAKIKLKRKDIIKTLNEKVIEHLPAYEARNVANVLHALATFELFDYRLMSKTEQLVLKDTWEFSLKELCNTAHAFAKLRHGNQPLFHWFFSRAQEIGASNWDVQSVTQLLDTCRRRKLTNEPILDDLERWCQDNVDRHDVLSLTQSTWSLVELKRQVRMDAVLSRFVQWHDEKALTPTQLAHIQFMLKQYRAADEDEFLSLTTNYPERHAFLKAVFAIPGDFHRTTPVMGAKKQPAPQIEGTKMFSPLG
eukprot:GEMP01055689.1.p1 GENE.GEMP01055689.1~~GEMP01055689.1.p1  ORF type:complete len:470 (+),score=81.72 GEMP01055689.1:25-1410(+)